MLILIFPESFGTTPLPLLPDDPVENMEQFTISQVQECAEAAHVLQQPTRQDCQSATSQTFLKTVGFNVIPDANKYQDPASAVY
jgi:hypothetical protein